MSEYLQNKRLLWFGHLKRTEEPTKCQTLDVGSKRRTERVESQLWMSLITSQD